MTEPLRGGGYWTSKKSKSIIESLFESISSHYHFILIPSSAGGYSPAIGGIDTKKISFFLFKKPWKMRKNGFTYLFYDNWCPFQIRLDKIICFTQKNIKMQNHITTTSSKQTRPQTSLNTMSNVNNRMPPFPPYHPQNQNIASTTDKWNQKSHFPKYNNNNPHHS